MELKLRYKFLTSVFLFLYVVSPTFSGKTYGSHLPVLSFFLHLPLREGMAGTQANQDSLWSSPGAMKWLYIFKELFKKNVTETACDLPGLKYLLFVLSGKVC